MADYAARRKKLISKLGKQGCDCLLVTNFKNVTYLTGFSGDDSYLLVSKDKVIIISDSRYEEQLQDECADVELVIRGTKETMLGSVERVLNATQYKRVGIEAASITLATYNTMREKLDSVELAPTDTLVEQLREIKDKHEIDKLREAVDYAQRAFGVVRAGLKPEQTELQVAHDLEHQARGFGARGCSFPPIVAVGPRAALPHASPTRRQMGESDFVLIDWGADVDGYKSDVTRVLVTGKLSPKLERIYRLVLKAQVAAIEAIKPGMTCGEVDAVARNIITKGGHGKHFGHGLGHGLGIDIHEQPRLSRTSKQELKAGMVITVEPGIYLPGFGGVRLEDDVLVTRTGHEVLTSVPKQVEDMFV
ncbi:MAG: Xaa-Pro peptidase family protein [Pirellulales bacterium]